jgi:hypothetical protein
MTRVVIQRVDFTGPFFTKDPAKTLRQNIADMMDRLAAEGERDVKQQISGRSGSMPGYTGWTHSRVRGRTSSLGGKRWAVTAVISTDTSGMSARDAIRTKAAAASIERRFHPFRRTSTALRRARAVVAANLTKGME